MGEPLVLLQSSDMILQLQGPPTPTPSPTLVLFLIQCVPILSLVQEGLGAWGPVLSVAGVTT